MGRQSYSEEAIVESVNGKDQDQYDRRLQRFMFCDQWIAVKWSTATDLAFG